LAHLRPPVHPACSFQQQRLRAYRDEQILIVGVDVRLEIESTLGPGEEVVDSLLDLGAHVSLQLIARYEPAANQDLAQPHVPQVVLCGDRRMEFLRGKHAAANENVPQPVATIHYRGVAYPAILEED